MQQETFETLLTVLDPKVEGDRVVLRFDGLEAAGGSIQLLVTAAAAFHERSQQHENMNKFKQILLAMHNYYDVYKMFPPRDEVRDKEGKTGLSWRVHILPFVEERRLYEEFHLDEPWDSPHNKALVERMPRVYRGGQTGVAPGQTTFLTPVGEDTVFGGKKATKFHNITDGTSNTAVLVQVQADRAVPWTAPQDYVFDPDAPARGLHLDAGGCYLTGIADGSVRRFSKDIEAEKLLWIFQKGDGHPIQ
jgi:hypothetical protein